MRHDNGGGTRYPFPSLSDSVCRCPQFFPLAEGRVDDPRAREGPTAGRGGWASAARGQRVSWVSCRGVGCFINRAFLRLHLRSRMSAYTSPRRRRSSKSTPAASTSTTTTLPSRADDLSHPASVPPRYTVTVLEALVLLEVVRSLIEASVRRRSCGGR
ncbi:hypothetical protein C8R45DRAFT_158613 [Mycena sanguinolenta]|nr:hypothetical protein C8R45DRAFT_158613 [Mycena sanguinolenta]